LGPSRSFLLFLTNTRRPNEVPEFEAKKKKKKKRLAYGLAKKKTTTEQRPG
jgi:hypothetical protein